MSKKGDVDPNNTDPEISKSPPYLPQDPDFGWNLNKTFRALRFPEDSEGHLWALPVILTDPSGGIAPTAIRIMNIDAEARRYGPQVYANQYVLRTDTGKIEMQRTPTVFKTIDDQANSFNLWDPTAGTRFRLMGFQFSLGKESTCAGAFRIQVLDGAIIIAQFRASSGALTVSATQGAQFVWNLPFNGYLSAAIDNILSVSFSGALTAGSASAFCWGCEEAT